MIIFTIILVTSLQGKIVNIEQVGIYELNTTLENCKKYVKPSFDRLYTTNAYDVFDRMEVITDCVKDN